MRDIAVPQEFVTFGEIGLSGEILTNTQMESPESQRFKNRRLGRLFEFYVLEVKKSDWNFL